MSPFAPLSFEPLAMERVWGGRLFETLLGKKLPKGTPVGELWEVVDRPEAQSVVRGGDFQGKTLHDLWSHHRAEIFGKRHSSNSSPRFPLLIKLLDARERLSVQVHPPADQAALLQGESKTECWYFLHASEQASIYTGLKKGVTREDFEKALQRGTVEETLHHTPVRTGESIFIPSGRLHAIGEGLLIVEVQQNSDSTYRVFDWNRLGLDGKPRDLHIEESMASIDFNDFEPRLTPSSESLIADCPYFHVEKLALQEPWDVAQKDDFSIITCLTGALECGDASLQAGEFMLIPASQTKVILTPKAPGTTILMTRLPEPETEAM
jgi:mannose-6-phosphate isomerase